MDQTDLQAVENFYAWATRPQHKHRFESSDQLEPTDCLVPDPNHYHIIYMMDDGYIHGQTWIDHVGIAFCTGDAEASVDGWQYYMADARYIACDLIHIV